MGTLLSSLWAKFTGADLRAKREDEVANRALKILEAASKNASELIEDLTLKMNKTRQTMITTELNEIVSGSEALGG